MRPTINAGYNTRRIPDFAQNSTPFPGINIWSSKIEQYFKEEITFHIAQPTNNHNVTRKKDVIVIQNPTSHVKLIYIVYVSLEKGIEFPKPVEII